MDQFRYGLRNTVPRCEDVVTLEQARVNCSIGADEDEHDETLVALIEAARNYVEEKAAVSLTTSTWEMAFDRFPRAKWLELPVWPLQSVVSVTYTDAAGDEQTIDTDKFAPRLDDSGRGRLALKNWEAWPTTKATPDAVKIVFTAGWQPADVPKLWPRLILALVAWWFDHPEAVVAGQAVTAPQSVDDLLSAAATADAFEDFDLCET